jgi:DNA mismatch repair protein MSH2
MQFESNDPRQMRTVVQVVGVAHTYVEVWERVSTLLAQLDVLLGFAELACNAPRPYVRPTMLHADEGTIALKGELQEGD